MFFSHLGKTFVFWDLTLGNSTLRKGSRTLAKRFCTLGKPYVIFNGQSREECTACHTHLLLLLHLGLRLITQYADLFLRNVLSSAGLYVERILAFAHRSSRRCHLLVLFRGPISGGFQTNGEENLQTDVSLLRSLLLLTLSRRSGLRCASACPCARACERVCLCAFACARACA